MLTAACLLAGALTLVATLGRQPHRPHGPYLIGAWTFGDRVSLRRAVAAGALDEVGVGLAAVARRRQRDGAEGGPGLRRPARIVRTAASS